MQKKIYYHDTDCGQVVYYANYLKYLEEARTEDLREKGLSLKELSKSNMLFVVRRVEIDYKSPAHYADELIITTEIAKIKNVSFEFYQEIKKDTQILVCAKTQLVCVGKDLKPIPLSEEISKCLRR